MSGAAAAYRLWARNNAYANRTLHRAMEGLDAAAYTAPRPGFFGSLAATSHHIWVVDLFYLDALEEAGGGHAVRDRAVPDSPAEMAELQARADARLIAFTDALGEDDLARRVVTERPEGALREAVGAILPHLFQHQVHHRGQAHVQLHHAGIAPPQLDDFFLEHDRAPLARELLA